MTRQPITPTEPFDVEECPSVVGQTYGAGLDESTARLLQTVAWEATADYYGGRTTATGRQVQLDPARRAALPFTLVTAC
jgi:hypothetical protein